MVNCRDGETYGTRSWMSVGHHSLRVAVPSDEQAVGALLQASYTVLMAPWYDAELLQRALPLMTVANPQLLRSDSFYIVESENGAVVGCGGWSSEQPGSGRQAPGEAHIRHFATHPQWTRRGIAKTILARCFEDSRAEDVALMHCNAALGSEPFYAAAGFEAVGPIQIAMLANVFLPATRMRRSLVAQEGVS